MTAKRTLEPLIQAYLDGTVSGEDAEQLNALLRGDADCRRRFAEALNLDSAIAAVAAGWPEEAAELADSEPSGAAASAPRRRVIPRRAAMAALGLAAAAAGVAGGSLWWMALSPDPFATVKNGIGAEHLPVGTALRGELYSIEAGTVELRTARGARVVIEAPATFRFEAEQALQMLRGRLAADVPSSARGFTVVTPSGRAIDLGTRFGVDVSEGGVSEVHVFEGEVVAKAAGDGDRRSLRAGDAVALGQGESAARSLRSSAFIQADEMQDLARGTAEAQRERAEAALAALRNDPARIAIHDFENDAEYPGTFRVVQGRWPGSQAPEFIHGGDHLKLDTGGERTWAELTLAAWVRLDHVGAPYQSLLHVDGWDDGEPGLVHWMVNEAATMRFAIWKNELAPDEDHADYYPDSRTPVHADEGRWVHLAAVYDSRARTVRFFHNGRFDCEVRLSVAHPARLGPLQIGNWNEAERKLSGRVDEIVIMGRAMVEPEIHALYEAGDPYSQRVP